MSFGGVVFVAAAMIGAAIIMYVLEPRRVKMAAAEPAVNHPEAKPEPKAETATQPASEVNTEAPDKPAEAASAAPETPKAGDQTADKLAA